jgi:type IV secretory pathway VirB10-like protein
MVNERLDTELSATARQIIADARGADDPTAEDEARVKARWLAGIAAGAGVSSLTEAVRAAAGSGWGLKAAAMVVAAAAASVGVYLGWPESKHEARPPTAVSVQAPAAAPVAPPAEPVAAVTQAAAPAPATELPSAAEVAALAPEPAAPAPAADTPPAATAAEVRSATPPRAAPSSVRPRAVAAERTRALPVSAEPAAAAPPVVGGQLGEEIALLSQIRGTLQAGAAARALEQLGEYRRRFDRPGLAMEADALQVDALCRAGQREAAQAAASAFLRNWPGSPLQQRVSSACP